MSSEGDDKDDGYEAVVGFSVPIRRVLGHEERPENPDGSRTVCALAAAALTETVERLRR